MTKLIAETAWHHEGDFSFMKNLVSSISKSSNADIVKMHITLDINEYMSKDHDSYKTLKSWMFNEEQWEELILIVRESNKELMLLLNDTKSVEFAAKYNPEYIELHSVCMNVPRLQQSILENIDDKVKMVVGVGGSTLEEVSEAVKVFQETETILMFGFQNYPTNYEDVNLGKIRKMQDLFPKCKFGYADHTAWDEENNELITLLVAANGMSFIEKHVTIHYGEERCDYSAAISIEKFNMLAKSIAILESIYGNSLMDLNEGEKAYSIYGPMKMAAVARNEIKSGDVLSIDKVNFCRTSQTTDMSQIDILRFIGKKFINNVEKGCAIDFDMLGKE